MPCGLENLPRPPFHNSRACDPAKELKQVHAPIAFDAGTPALIRSLQGVL